MCMEKRLDGIKIGGDGKIHTWATPVHVDRNYNMGVVYSHGKFVLDYEDVLYCGYGDANFEHG